MDVKSSQTLAGPDLARDAEDLLRSLAGVSHAHVQAGPRGIDAIHVVASDPDLAPALAGHVRSALLAGLATPILPARIHVRVADPNGNDADDDAERAAQHAAHRQPTSRIRILDPDTQPGPRAEATTTAREAPTPTTADPASQAHDETRPVHLPRLVAVERQHRDDGRVLCRVTIAFKARVHTADAVAVDLPGAAAHAAAQAAVRALGDGGLDGLELDGLREIEIAGREYTVVALRRTDTSVRVRAGSTPVTGAPERAAATAAVTAARELL